MQPLCRGARRRRWSRETVQPWKSTAHKGAPRNWRLNAQVDCFPVFTLGLSLCDDHIVAETREILAGEIEGHYSPDEITVYESVGYVVQDLAHRVGPRLPTRPATLSHCQMWEPARDPSSSRQCEITFEQAVPAGPTMFDINFRVSVIRAE